MKKKLLKAIESDFPKIRAKLEAFESEYIAALKREGELLGENAKWDVLSRARMETRLAEKKFWAFKAKTNHLPLGFSPAC